MKFTSTLRGDRGTCDIATRTIEINSRLRGKVLTDTIIHEVTHARAWDLDDECVADIGADCANLLHNPKIKRYTDGHS